MTDIYYVEDDEAIARAVACDLSARGYRVTILPSVAKARDLLPRRLPALILIDWNMPDGRGDALCRWVRSRFRKLPIIFLTVRGDAKDIVSGLENGADDYVVKPFNLDVLHSRIAALLRRAGTTQEDYLSCGSLAIDRSRTAVFADNAEVSLSPSEYRLLLYLMQNKERTVSREELLERLWDEKGCYVNDNTLSVTMKRLREKLHHPACLKTIRSIGYRMEEI